MGWRQWRGESARSAGRSVLWCGLSLVLAVVVGPSPVARATAWQRLPSESEALRGADVVFVGVVTAIRTLQQAESSSLVTEIRFAVERRVKGETNDEEVLVERGGYLGGRSEWVGGSPEYDLGERVLVHASRLPSGNLRTWAMALGRGAVRATAPDRLRVSLSTGPRPRETSLRSIERRARRLGLEGRRADPNLRKFAAPAAAAPLASQSLTSFRFLSPAQRWDQPVVPIWMSPGGHPVFGRDESRAMLERIAASWTAQLGGRVRVEYAGESDEVWRGCSLPGIAVIWDFHDEDGYPVTESCDVLAGRPPAFTPVCGTVEDVPGTGLRRTAQAYVVVPHRRLDCQFYNLDSLKYAEMLTHEVGHALGLAHSCEFNECSASDHFRSEATMNFSAHFDGRDATLRDYDVGAIQALYDVDAETRATRTPRPTSTPVPTFTPVATFTESPATSTPRPTRTPRPTATPRPTQTRDPEPTRTSVPEPTPTPGVEATRTPRPTRTRAPTAVPTSTPSATTTPARTTLAPASPTPTPTADPGNRSVPTLSRVDVKFEEAPRLGDQTKVSAILEMPAPPAGQIPSSTAITLRDGSGGLQLVFPETARRSTFGDRSAKFVSGGWTASWSRIGGRARIVVAGMLQQATGTSPTLWVTAQTNLGGAEALTFCVRKSTTGGRGSITSCQRAVTSLVKRPGA